MLGIIAYYIFIYPLSFLPLRILYLISDFFYLLLRTVFPYRRKVVRDNIYRSFPQKSEHERRKIEHRFFRHLADLLAESIKNLSISKKELLKRMTVENPEVMHRLFEKNKSVLLVSGHYNNWEWMITAQHLLFPYQAVGIGMPLSSSFFDKVLNKRRARFGMKIIHSKIVHDFFSSQTDITATLVLADQSPGDSIKCYWTNFLNQETGFIFGPEMLANKYNQAVVFFEIQKKKRGYYTIALEEITAAPRELKYGEITETYIQHLESLIQQNPQYWLWSHKRWKKTPPENLGQIRQQQKDSFEQKYRR